MALRAMGYWKSMAKGLRGLATSTPPKMKAYATPAELNAGYGQASKPAPAGPKGDFVPVYVAVGMIGLSVMFGLHTAKQQLMHSPNVFVKKKHRETVPEVAEPDYVLDCADKFMHKSFFRKVAHVQDPQMNYTVKDSTRGDAYAHTPRAETLKSVGV